MDETNNIENVETAKPKRRWLRNTLIGIAAFIVLYIILVAVIVAYFPGAESDFGGGGIAIIRIEGTLAAAGDEGFLGGGSVTPDSLIDQMHEAAEDDAVDAVVLRINSPGGTASAGEEVYSEVKWLRSKKPVVVSIADVGASAAYMIASPANKIVAAPSSLVGSIGTIIVVPNYQGLMEKIGVKYTVIAKGKYKDMGDPNRPLTPEETDILDKQSQLVYNNFIDYVARARGLPRARVAKMATGQAFLGTEGKELGLVDKIGNFQDAIDLAAKLGKISGEPEIIEYEQSSFLQTFSQIFSDEKSKLKNELLRQMFSSAAASVK